MHPVGVDQGMTKETPTLFTALYLPGIKLKLVKQIMIIETKNRNYNS
jgi:hypothetical protein